MSRETFYRKFTLFCRKANFVENLRIFEGTNFLVLNAVVEKKMTYIRYVADILFLSCIFLFPFQSFNLTLCIEHSAWEQSYDRQPSLTWNPLATLT